MKRYFRTIQSVLDSRWGNFRYAGTPTAQKTDRVLQSSKLEDCIYRDLSRDDENLEAIQQEAAPKLHSFPALSRDIFQSFYSLFPKRTDADRLTAEAQKFIDNLELFSLLANVADVKSLAIHPASTTHSECNEAELLDQGIKPNTIRLSIGTENIDDIIEDLDEAFKAIQE